MKAIAVIAALISLSVAPSVPAQQAGDLRLNLTLTGDLFVSYDVIGPGQPFRLRALCGVPDWRLLFVRPAAAEIAFGASLEAAYELDGPWGVFLRTGAGVPFFLEDADFGHRTTSYPLGLWPDLSAGAKLTLQ